MAANPPSRPAALSVAGVCDVTTEGGERDRGNNPHLMSGHAPSPNPAPKWRRHAPGGGSRREGFNGEVQLPKRGGGGGGGVEK